MEILAPCCQPDEVEPLVSAGATALYCGVFDEGWARRWGLGSWPNRRGPGPANLGSLAELEQVVSRARAEKTGVLLALNAPFYDPAQGEAVVRMARRSVEIGVAGLVIGDPGLLARLAAESPEIELVASTLCVARNSRSVTFLRDAGADRVILSRQLALDEIRRIRQQSPGVKLECFVLNDSCAFEEGCCFSAHALPGFDSIYCLTDWQTSDARMEPHREWLRAIAERGFSGGRLPLGPCGLCAIPDLAEAGVDSVKIVGREAHPYRKVRSVQMVRRVMDVLEQEGASAARRAAVALREDVAGCGGGLSCYYPEVRPTAGSGA